MIRSTRSTRTARTAAAALAATGLALTSLALTGPASGAAPGGNELGRQVLSPGDGWGSHGAGTTGGSAAAPQDVTTVSTWQELRAALGGRDPRQQTTPRIVYVDGMLDANTDADGRPLSCADYAADGWSLEEYVADFEAWEAAGNPRSEWTPPAALEAARQQSYRNQNTQIRQFVPSNTTIVGLGDDAGITGGSLTVQEVGNVIVRNLHLQDASDCFPSWDPGDGSAGNWNAEYDTLWVVTSRNVWVDHNTFSDGENGPRTRPDLLGRKFEVHDGLLDITNGSDLVTVSYNHFRDHDKMMLWGSTNTARPVEDPRSDVDRLRITFHHNLVEDSGQRTPRVRFGQVHVYNNLYVQPERGFFQYAWGAGVRSQILAENNFFELADDIAPAEVIRTFDGTQLTATGTLVNGRSPAHAVDLVAEFNAGPGTDLTDVTWTPPYPSTPRPTQAVPGVVRAQAGAGHLR